VLGYVVLALAAVAYAIGIVAQTTAARRVEVRDRVDPGLLARLATDRIYLLGFASQVAGFVLTFLARATLPLYLVQAGASSAVGLAALIGVTLLGWKVRAVEIGVLVIMATGLVLLVSAAEPSVANDLPITMAFGLVGILALTAILAVPAARLRGARGAVAMGVLAGVAFAVLAIASRPIANGPLLGLIFEPLAWLMVVSALIGQTLLAAALQRGSATATAASMDATTAVLASVVGLAVLGDQVAAGRMGWVVGGLILVVGGVLAMAAVSATTTVAPAPHGRLERVGGPAQADGAA
jgi:drug/metabolite transporter (DMT)-like permease